MSWFNETFGSAFPKLADIAVGAVPYECADATNAPYGGAELHGFEDDDGGTAEAAFIVDRIKQLRRDSADTSIAVLARSRLHFNALIELLQRECVNYVANDLKPLASIASVGDLICLTRWVLDVNDDIAFASILRAPACGADLGELFVLKTLLQRPEGWFLQLKDCPEWYEQPRFASIAAVLIEAWCNRQRQSLANTVEGMWQAIGYVGDADAAAYAEQYFAFLRAEGDAIGSATQLAQRIAKHYAQPVGTDNAVQLMTIHKSKGLQFDNVFVIRASQGTRQDSAELLNYAERLHDDGSASFLLAPWGRREIDKALVNYVTRLNKQAGRNEILRVLYVAATRAARRLYISFTHKCDANGLVKPPSKQSLLHPIWPIVMDQVQAHTVPVAYINDTPRPFSVLRWQGARHTRQRPEPDTEPALALTPNAEASPETALGELVHKLFELIATAPASEVPNTSLSRFIATQLRDSHSIIDKASAMAVALQCCKNATTTALGRWLFGQYEVAYNEWSISTRDANGSNRHIIDRCFVDNETTWIIDYKISQPTEGQALEAFIERQILLYRDQLQRYWLALKRLDWTYNKNLKTALYFPLINHLEVIDVSN